MVERSIPNSPRRRVLLLTPITPAPTGNGLAMRAALAVEGLARTAELWTAVVPVSDPHVDEQRLRWVSAHCECAVVVPLAPRSEAAVGWLGCATGRSIVAAAQPLPLRARSASPACGRVLRNLFSGTAFDTIWVLRLYLAGVAAPFLEEAPRPRLVLDVDDDDEATLEAIAQLHDQRGEAEAAAHARAEAGAYGRLAAACLPRFDLAVTASPVDTRSLCLRHGVHGVQTLPNAVRTSPRAALRGHPRGNGEPGPKIVFVGNLDYLPNLDAVERLAMRVLPIVRRALPDVQLHVAGVGGGVAVAALRQQAGVHLHGPVDDLAGIYRIAALTVVPLRAGGGSRLKILEAFARGVPVVATPEAAAGLDVRNGEHLLICCGEELLARAAIQVVADARLAERLAASAWRFVAQHHDLDRVATMLGELAEPPR